MTRLNIGAGGDIQPTEEGWVNADIRPLPGIGVVCDARSLPFPDGHFGEVKAFDVLEHIPPADAEAALREWNRVLAPGGVLNLRIPDLLKIAMRLLNRHWGSDRAHSDQIGIGLLYGDQRPECGGTEWGSHKWGYTEPLLRDYLFDTGFSLVEVKGHTDEHNLYCRAVKRA